MNREEVLAKHIEVIDPIYDNSEGTVISECEDIDSLALFGIVVFLKGLGKNYSLADLAKCNKVSDFIDLAIN